MKKLGLMVIKLKSTKIKMQTKLVIIKTMAIPGS